MTIEKKIKMLLAYTGVSQADLARLIGTSPQNLNQKMKRNSLTFDEMEKIAHAIGAEWRAEFVIDGKII